MDTDDLEKISGFKYDSENVGDISVGIKIISIIYYIFASALAIVGIFIIVSAIQNSLMPDYKLNLLMFFTPLILLYGFATWFFFIARGLHLKKNWARINAIVLAIIILVLYAFITMSGSSILRVVSVTAQDIISSVFTVSAVIVIEGTIAGYLLFNKKVKEEFA